MNDPFTQLHTTLTQRLDQIEEPLTSTEEIAAAVIGILFCGSKHLYFSTSCLHDDHGYCQQQTGNMGLKNPAECKFCNRPCLCVCHRKEDPPPETQ
jgi:hypothetical protein